jgi:hypothetical protein
MRHPASAVAKVIFFIESRTTEKQGGMVSYSEVLESL